MEEVKRVSLIAAPMVIVSVSQYLLTAVSLMMAGHLGQLHLSAVSVAASFTNATRFPVLFGLSGALETLCGQVYGARQYKKIGSYTYTAISSLVSICVLISILWIFMDKLLISIGFDPQISRVASRYSIALIPALFGYAILQSLIRYFQSQGFTLPILVTSSVTFCFHLPLCWALIYKCHFGEIGGSISIGLAYWLNVFLLGLYMRYSPSCQQTRCFCFKEVCSSLHQFWHFAFPSAVMVCLEWWTFEVLILMAGKLRDPKLETSVLSICMTTTSLHYFVQYGVGVAASTRVSNELGAGNPKAARSVVWVVLGISLTEAAIVSTSLFCARNVFGYAYSNDKQVIKYVSQIAPLLSLSIISDTMQAILSGVTRGCGLQRTGAFINLGAYYFVGMPISIVLCFLMHFRAKGLWMGALIGSLLQAAFLALVTLFINWNNQATMAKDRILKHQLQSTVEGIEL
ncbi:protein DETOXIFICATION 7-like isoform X1 [Euphorbia lathyris]|uniref:protein DETOXIFICATION 7-like isoform X1 n=1 Tax=Euphorbia lathyris TaxID=212925 RepID=UPI003313CF77